MFETTKWNKSTWRSFNKSKFNKKSTLKYKSHWIGLRGNLQETAETPIFNGKNYAFL